MVLGPPCNQFGAQAPGAESEIAQFYESNYGVSFSIFAKIEVSGPNAEPLCRFFKQQQPGVLGLEAIRWNFTKFLVDRTGMVIDRFAPVTPPAKLAPAIEKALCA